MKLELELPDWCNERHIYVLAGIELVAFKQYGKDWTRIKTVRCNECGECCKDIKTMPCGADGYCIYSEQQGEVRVCSLGVKRPFVCCVGDPMTSSGPLWDKCCIEFEEKE
jgi:hypothetical protein